MIVFKLPNGKCILHTGDFRACPEMESEPIFWNNDIDTIYLDTTYLPQQYSFCTQHESIDRGKEVIEKFRERHPAKRILYVCGAYVIGKEKFWCALAQEFQMKVWAEGNRRKALQVMELPELDAVDFVADPEDADLHVIPLAKLSYPVLLEYFKAFSHQYHVLLALRPSGWEKNSRPRFGGQINVVGIEYSEHSSCSELERFVKYLKPREVISTVPVGRNIFDTALVPASWYQYDKLTSSSRNYQPSITNFLTMKTAKSSIAQAKLMPVANFSQKLQSPSKEETCGTPNKSTPLACVGSIGQDRYADALDDWL